MSIALTGFLTGFAEGATERIKREREENEAMIENRLKRAQTNRLLFQKEQDAQKQLYRTRYDSVSAYMPEGATEEQKLALISNDEIAKQFTELRAKGEEVDLNRFLVMNKDKIPKNFSSVQQYIDNISVAPAPVAQEQVDAIRQTRGFLGSRTGANIEKAAGQFGTSAAELLAYEQAPSLQSIPEFARMNVEMLRKPKDFKTRIAELETQALAAGEAGDKSTVETIRGQIETLTQLKDSVSPAKQDFAENLSRLKMIAMYGSPEERVKAEEEILEAVRLDKLGVENKKESKILSASDFRANIKTAIANDLEKAFGTRMKEGWTKQIGLDGVTVYGYTGVGPKAVEIENEKREVERKAIERVLFPYIHNGEPANETVASLMRAYDIPFPTPAAAAASEAAPAPAVTPAAAPAAPRTSAPASVVSGQTATGIVTQASAAPAAADGDVYRFENLTSSVREAAIRDAERFGIRNLEKVFSDKDEFNSQPLQKRKQLFEAYSTTPRSAPTNRSVSNKTRTRAQVQAVAKANGVSYEDAAAGAKAQGYTITD